MLLRILMISLATIVLSSFLLFMYFKRKISKVEEKVDIMFGLIQEHVNDRPPPPQNMHFAPSMPNMASGMDSGMNKVNLIDVSDQDESDDSEQEEDDSDSDENNTEIDDDLVIGNNYDETIKKIELENPDIHQEALHIEDFIINKNNGDNDDLEVHHDDNDDNDDDDDDDDNDDDDDDDDENNLLKVDLTGLKVPDLKELCEKKGLKGYKKFKKSQLIELLSE